MSSSADSASAPASSSSDGRGRFIFACREFWRGLTTPDFGCVLLASGILCASVITATWLARGERVARDQSGAWLESASTDYSRASVMAMQGLARHAPGPEPTLLFLGPSTTRFWLPVAAEAGEAATAAAGHPVRVLTMCGNGQSYATSAALIERGGTDFDGFVVLGICRQVIGRAFTVEDVGQRTSQSGALGFTSSRLLSESAFLGHPQAKETGWELWDHSNFYFYTRLGLAPWLPEALRPSYVAYWTADRPVDVEKVRGTIPPLSRDMLERHLAVLGRIVADARRTGRAKVVLAETPWIDRFAPVLQDEAWKRDEEIYANRLAEWSREQDVPWLDFANRLPAGPGDFVDPRHVGSAELRRRFVSGVVRELGMARNP